MRQSLVQSRSPGPDQTLAGMNPDRLILCTELDLPRRGSSVRVAIGDSELVFEVVRGGYALLWHAGREARRHVLGLPDTGTLHLELRAPQLPVRLLLRETITLAPRARIHGYVQVPLVPTLTLQDGDTDPVSLVEFAPPSLAAEWDDAAAAVHSCTSSWFVRWPVHGGEARATMPLWLWNDSDAVCAPSHLPLTIATDELSELRSAIATVPRRLIWNGSAWRAVARTIAVPV